MADEPKPARRLGLPNDESASRTMSMGLLGSVFIYGLSLVVIPLFPGSTGRIASIALIAVSLLFLTGWFFAVRAGFRLVGRKGSRAERRARDHKRHEREKRMRLR